MLSAKTILFITSFIPVIAFKVLARIGEATLAQAKIATVIGFILAGIQFALSRQFLKCTTYLERTFLCRALVEDGPQGDRSAQGSDGWALLR